MENIKVFKSNNNETPNILLKNHEIDNFIVPLQKRNCIIL